MKTWLSNFCQCSRHLFRRNVWHEPSVCRLWCWWTVLRELNFLAIYLYHQIV